MWLLLWLLLRLRLRFSNVSIILAAVEPDTTRLMQEVKQKKASKAGKDLKYCD